MSHVKITYQNNSFDIQIVKYRQRYLFSRCKKVYFLQFGVFIFHSGFSILMFMKSSALSSKSAVNCGDPAISNAVGKISVPLLITNNVHAIKRRDNTVIVIHACA